LNTGDETFIDLTVDNLASSITEGALAKKPSDRSPALTLNGVRDSKTYTNNAVQEHERNKRWDDIGREEGNVGMNI
jgi:hypothetical protein